MTRESAINELMELFKENEELFNRSIEELDAWNGYLGDNRYYYMEELGELYSNAEPTELLFRAFYGHDEETGGQFNPNRDYFSFNAYGNLVSADRKDYSAYLDRYFIERVIDESDHLYLDDEIMEIIKNIDDEEAV